MEPTSPLPLLHDSAATACCAGAVPASPRTRNEETGRLPRLWALSGSRRWLQFLLGLAALAVVPTVLEFVPSQYLLAEAGRNLWFVAREMWGVLPYLVTTNLFPHRGIVLGIASSYAEALFLPEYKESRLCSSYAISSIG